MKVPEADSRRTGQTAEARPLGGSYTALRTIWGRKNGTIGLSVEAHPVYWARRVVVENPT